MEEARTVLDRLARIERLRSEGAASETLLDELRRLVAEAETWVEAEREGGAAAAAAVEHCREALRGAHAMM